MATPRLFVHIGLQKTGTSFLQRIFWDSVPELARQGVDLVPDTKLAMFRLMLDVRERFDPEIDPPSVTRALARLPEQLAAAQDTALITQESLATATPEQIARFVAATTDRELHIVLTLRDLGRQIPSAWQQTLQTGRSERMGRYLARLEESAGTDARAWRTMDVPAIVARWREAVPAERIHIVTVPPAGSSPTLLLERFCSVIGIDPAGLTIATDTRGNRSLRAEQAEVLRRVNARLSPDFKRRDVYGDLGKRYFAVQVLGDDQGTRIRLPRERHPWVTAISETHREFLASGGFPVVGDLDELLPREQDFAEDDFRVSEKQVADIATRALTDMLEHKAADRREARTAAPATPAVAAAVPEPVVGLLRRLRRR